MSRALDLIVAGRLAYEVDADEATCARIARALRAEVAVIAALAAIERGPRLDREELIVALRGE